MRKISREELIERTKHSKPYPVGEPALGEYYEFFKPYMDVHEVRVLATLMKLNEVEYEGTKLVLFDTPKLQDAYKEMGEVLAVPFVEFLFHGLPEQ